MNKFIKKEITFAGKNLVLETGKLALMSDICVKATFGDTVALVNVVKAKSDESIDFFPLTINYMEKYYASGRIKSSRFVKRDGRATDEAIIAGRIIDHAVRPLFPKDYVDEVQITIYVLSLDPECDPQFLSMIATSAALTASEIPFKGPMVSARVGFINDDYVLCPPQTQNSITGELDMMVSFVGEDFRFLALEAEAQNVPERKVLGAMEFAKNHTEDLYKFIKEFAAEVNPENKKYEYTKRVLTEEIKAFVNNIAQERVTTLFGQGFTKDNLEGKLSEIMDEVKVKAVEAGHTYSGLDLAMAFEELEKKVMRTQILSTGLRIDGRKINEVRPLSSEVSVLPRVHGSAIFNRGITQVLTVATLASQTQELLIDDMYGERTKRYMHFYNFPPFSGGTTGRMSGPKNREIGHGMLAEKALVPVLPSQEEFPYVLRLVSEVLSSSGSTSMASTCASTLALLDAGVPLKHMVGGISIGLICDDNMENNVIMTDLAYMEDALGFMDFKVTGTRDGVTAIQCDMKLPGIPYSLLPEIFEQSKAARMVVLDSMEKAISKPNAISQYAPKFMTLHIKPSKIGMVIGSGGKTINEIQDTTQTEIHIEDDGTVVVSGSDMALVEKALKIIEGITKDIERGEIYDGVIKDLLDFGALVEILPGKVGLLHISEISNEYVKDIKTVLKVGETVRVKVLDTSQDGKISLSKKAV